MRRSSGRRGRPPSVTATNPGGLVATRLPAGDRAAVRPRPGGVSPVPPVRGEGIPADRREGARAHRPSPRS
ncbi:hypothetical protein NS283_12380 [Microbacterium testaceum]|nr:hypothetical protein NS283_12380 [Microbacterium testaceum]